MLSRSFIVLLATLAEAVERSNSALLLLQQKQLAAKVLSSKEPEEPLIDNSPGSGSHDGELQKCQGNCDGDGDCTGELVCVEPKFMGWDGLVPGCSTTDSNRPLWGWKYCTETPPDGWETETTTTTTVEYVAPAPAPSVVDNCPVGGVCARLMAFNVYYAALGKEERMEGIADAVATMVPDIAVITEQWREKNNILDKIREKSARNYEYCRSGPQEKWWDGDILYRADLFEVLEDGVMDWGSNRGLSWAVLKHRASGKQLMVYGAHPVCCGNEHIHLQNAVDFSEHAKGMVEKYPNAPIIIMGDFNALEDWKSTQLYKGATVENDGKYFSLDFKFRDSFRDTNSYSVDATTHSSGARLDYIFAENGNQRQTPIDEGFRTMSSWIWRQAPGGSDHYPILAEFEII